MPVDRHGAGSDKRAMRADRPYRAALSVEQALDQIRDGRGTQFDPELADIFLELLATGVIGELPLRTRA